MSTGQDGGQRWTGDQAAAPGLQVSRREARAPDRNRRSVEPGLQSGAAASTLLGHRAPAGSKENHRSAPQENTWTLTQFRLSLQVPQSQALHSRS